MIDILTKLITEVKDLEKRLHNMISYGTIATVDPVNYTCTVSCGDIETAPIRWMVKRAAGDKEWFTPDIGEQVLVVSPSGELSQGVALTGLFSDVNPQNDIDPNIHRIDYEDGSFIEHNKALQSLHLHAPNKIILTSTDIEIAALNEVKVVANTTKNLAVANALIQSLTVNINGTSRVDINS
ncbi:MAG: phage baseplate assembly protein V [Lentisphaeraceae bacterium]|nr:phage baseplate assembly protein V [Lentisphaeraceae bacterium]